MGGIAGIYHLSGASVGDGVPRRMIEALRHRGPAGCEVRRSESIALLQFKLHTTPPSLATKHASSGPARAKMLVCDARIDNRDELLSRLRPHGPLACVDGSGSITDSDLILAAYDKWGIAFPKHLLGAFVFALWDEGRERLLCARDQLGIKPCYYSFAARHYFAFASEIKALLAWGGVPDGINEDRVAEYLSGLCLDTASTFYQNIERLPPGHILDISPGGMSLKAYWTLEHSEPSCSAREEIIEQFRELFTDAVCVRTRGPGDVGAYLSGGLDSSSIARMLARIGGRGTNSSPIHCFSGTFEKLPECDESHYINEVVADTDLQLHKVEVNSDYNPIREIAPLIRIWDEPAQTHFLSLPWRLNTAVVEADVSVVLDGHGGDEVVSRGVEYLHHLASTGKWGPLLWELYTGPEEQIVKQFTRLVTEHRELKGMGEGIRRLLGRWVRANSSSYGGATPSLLRPAFRRRVRLDERVQEWQATRQTRKPFSDWHQGLLKHPLQVKALEELNHLAASFGIEARFPFWDRRLVNFCLTVPPTMKRRNGRGRYVLREAMRGILPDAVRRRRHKTYFNASVNKALEKAAPNLRIQLELAKSELVDWVAPQLIERIGAFVLEGRGDVDEKAFVQSALRRLLYVSAWKRML